MDNKVKIISFNTIDSTHAYANRMVDSGLIDQYMQTDDDSCCIVVAEKQTDGIGRSKRSWISQKGNLFASIIMWLPKDRDFGELSLAVGCAVRDTIAHMLPEHISHDIKLHWPNDLYYHRKKVSGILMAISGDYLIISVGININSSPHGVDNIFSISVREILGKKSNLICTKQTLNTLQKKMKQWFLDLNNVGFSCIRLYWLKNISEINCDVTIRNGSDSISGFFVDIDNHGRLILEKDGQCKLISSGDLFRNQEGIVIQYE